MERFRRGDTGGASSFHLTGHREKELSRNVAGEFNVKQLDKRFSTVNPRVLTVANHPRSVWEVYINES